MVEEFDAIIVGAGPGGSSCAAFLRKYGRNVLLLDKAKFPRDKTCGDGCSGKSKEVLRELNLEEIVKKQPHGRIGGVIFSSPDGTTVQIPIPKNSNGTIDEGYCVRREVFDNVLFQNAKEKGAQIVENFTITDLLWENNKVVGVKGNGLDGEKTFKAKVVVGADGFASVVADKVKSKKLDPAHLCTALRMYYKGVKDLTPNIELHFVDDLIPGYFWIFPLENGMANVGSGMLSKELKAKGINLKETTLKIIREHPNFKKRFEGAEMVGPVKGWSLPFGSTQWPIAGNGWILIGDAASLIDPFTGEGIGNALLSGKLAAERINEALDSKDFSKEFLFEYEKKLRKTVDRELQNSYRMQKLGSHKWLLNFFLHKASKSKEVKEAIADTLLDSKARNKFMNPMFYIKVLLA